MSITLSWSPPLVTNGRIIQYHVHLVECPTDILTITTVMDTNLMLVDLHPHYTYKYQVSAATAVGVGPLSHNSTVQLDEAGIFECLFIL